MCLLDLCSTIHEIQRDYTRVSIPPEICYILSWNPSLKPMYCIHIEIPHIFFKIPSPSRTVRAEDKLCNQFASPCLAEGKLFAPPWEAGSYLVLDLEKPEPVP